LKSYLTNLFYFSQEEQMKFFGARRIFLFINAAVVLSFSIAFVARAQDNSGYRKVGLKHASRHSSMTAEPGSFETARAAFPAFR